MPIVASAMFGGRNPAMVAAVGARPGPAVAVVEDIGWGQGLFRAFLDTGERMGAGA